LGLAEIVTLKIELEGKGFDENDPEFVTWVVLNGAWVELFGVSPDEDAQASGSNASSNAERKKEEGVEVRHNTGKHYAYGKEIKMRVLVNSAILNGEMVIIRVFTKNFDHGEIAFNLCKPESWSGKFMSKDKSVADHVWGIPGNVIDMLCGPNNANFEGLIYREINLGEETFPEVEPSNVPRHSTGDSVVPSEGAHAIDYSMGFRLMRDTAGGLMAGSYNKKLSQQRWPTREDVYNIILASGKLEIKWNCGFEFWERAENGLLVDYSLTRYGGRMTPTWQIWTYTCIDRATETYKFTVSKFGTLYTKVVAYLFGADATTEYTFGEGKTKNIFEEWSFVDTFTREQSPGEYIFSEEDYFLGN